MMRLIAGLRISRSVGVIFGGQQSRTVGVLSPTPFVAPETWRQKQKEKRFVNMSSAKSNFITKEYTYNNETFSVCEATMDDVQELIRFISTEKPYWMKYCSESRFRSAIQIDPSSVLVAKDRKHTICGSITGFQIDDFFIISFLLTRENLRLMGLGKELGQVMLERASDRNKNVIGCATEIMIPTYMKYGMKIQAHQTSWSGLIYKTNCNMSDVQNTSMVTNVLQQDIAEVVEYDKILHPYQREWFVENRISRTDGQLACIARLDSHVVGYGYITRHTQSNYGMGLFADNEDIARQLLSSLLKQIPDGSMLFLLVPGQDENPFSRSLAEEVG